ncbi:hypothetical protein [Mycobacterium sp. NS-7484]|uniref:hypothetical protein n=1 Tax=Mycobacterium sp. NS-7484 TaxID=1834161 RepID=UPI001E5CFAB6|nr:hypothetical protein [Mycobacterium sp. NS-7484]
MITYQVQAATTARVKTKKNRRVAVGLLLAVSGAALWAVSAIAGGLDVAAPSVQLTGAATSIEAHGCRIPTLFPDP